MILGSSVTGYWQSHDPGEDDGSGVFQGASPTGFPSFSTFDATVVGVGGHENCFVSYRNQSRSESLVRTARSRTPSTS